MVDRKEVNEKLKKASAQLRNISNLERAKSLKVVMEGFEKEYMEPLKASIKELYDQERGIKRMKIRDLTKELEEIEERVGGDAEVQVMQYKEGSPVQTVIDVDEGDGITVYINGFKFRT